MEKKICRYCESYHPCEKFRGVLGTCDIQKAAKGIDNTCDAFREGPQTWMCGEPVRETRRYAAGN